MTTTTSSPPSSPTTGEVGSGLVRRVASSMHLRTDGPSSLAMQVAVASHVARRDEALVVTVDGQAVTDVRELSAPVGGRVHVADVGAGDVQITYSATVTGGSAADNPSPAPTEEELLAATRPSRYADSDRLVALAASELDGLAGVALADGASAWVAGRLSYVLGSSRPIDAASDVLLAGQGVCRDYAHLVAALLRARDVPARVVAVYAPGLYPMDFHAVTEAWVQGAWHLLDATGLAPRTSLVRIATGRDTSDTAFLTTTGPVVLLDQQITATVEGDLPVDDGGPVHLA